jgi:hypothetical protein
LAQEPSTLIVGTPVADLEIPLGNPIDTTKIITHGGQWVDKIRRLRKRQALPERVLFPVTAPTIDARAYRAFEEIREDLAAERVEIVPAASDQQILNFAQAR